MKTNQLYRGSLCVLAFLVMCFSLRASIPYTRTESGAARVGDRPRTLKKVMILAERQMYWPSPNYLHKYNDRPLFYDPSLRGEKDGVGGVLRGYWRDMKILQNVGLDGFAGIAFHSVNEGFLKLLEKQPPPHDGFRMMPVLFTSDGGVNLNEGVAVAPGFKAVYDREKAYLLACAKSPYVAKVEGKVVFWTYADDEKTQRKWAEMLRADPEVPPFVMFGQMPWYDIYKEFISVAGGKEVSPATLAAVRERVVAAAKAMGGLKMWMVDYEDPWNGEYAVKTIPTKVWRNYLAPLAADVLKSPELKGTLVGAFIRQAYVNQQEACVKGNFGTATLRTNLDEILAINPDVLVGFEWNEQSENTHFQPTVAHGKIWARILNYYRSLLDREPPKPMRGDDTAIPNLIVSTRQAIKVGEPYHLELLYLPDGSREKVVTAQVTLRDENGKELVTFPKEDIPTTALKAIDYRIPSEKLSDCLAVTPEVRVTYAGAKKLWKGFDATRLSPTMCRDYLYTQQALRELLEPTDAQLQVVAEPAADTYRIAASLSAPEPLATVEVLDGLDEIAAANPDNNWYDTAKYAVFRVELATVKPSFFGHSDETLFRKGAVTFAGTSRGEVRDSEQMWGTAWVRDRRSDGSWGVDVRLHSGISAFFVRVPRKDLKQTKMTLAVTDLQPVVTDLSEVERLGVYRHACEKTVTVKVSRLDNLADIPQLLAGTEATVARTFASENRYPICQLRAVTRSGKVYRSAVVVPKKPSAERTQLNVWSDTLLKPVQIPVRRDLVPVYDYVFEPSRGALMKNGWEGRADALLGGCSHYGWPLHLEGPLGKLPPDFVGKTAPDWVLDGKDWILRFRGGTYLCLPQEVIPRGAEYAVEFEIKPTSLKDQVLIRSSSGHSGDNGLQLLVKNGTLHLSYYGIAWYTPPDFDTKAPLKVGEWNRIRLVKRLESLECEVNGALSKFRYDRRARKFSCHIFGSNLSVNETVKKGIAPFEGDLRALRIFHDPAQGGFNK